MKKLTKIVVVYIILAVACAVVIGLFSHPFYSFNAEKLSSKPDEYIDIIDLPESDPYLEEAIANPGESIRVDEPEKSTYYQIATSQEIFNVKVGDSYYHVVIEIGDPWIGMLLPGLLLISTVLAWITLGISHLWAVKRKTK